MKRWGLFTICCALLAWGLFSPTPPPDPFANSDKVAHFLAFMALGLTARYAFYRLPSWLVWGAVLAAAPALEWLQHQVSPLRQLSLGDAVANVLGVLLALALRTCLAWSRADRG